MTEEHPTNAAADVLPQTGSGWRTLAWHLACISHIEQVLPIYYTYTPSNAQKAVAYTRMGFRISSLLRRRIALIPGIPLFIALFWLLTHPYKVKTTFSYVTRPLWDHLVYPTAPIINLASDALFASHGSDPHYICSIHNGSLPRQAGDARIWDAIIFSQELDMLEIHLAELYDVVDKFIILESTVTYSGQPKDLVFQDNAARFKRFSDKISHHVFADSDTAHFSYKPGDFAIELQQRSAMTGIIDSLYHTEPAGQGQDTLVLVADVDEIPYDHTLRLIKTCALPPILHLQLTPYVYSFEWVSGDLDSWHIQLHTWIPGQSWYRHFSKSTEDYITSAGTHCSFCFPKIQDFQWKMRAYSHNDRLGDHPKALLRTEAIQGAICRGENLFGMLPEAYTWWDLFNRWNGHAARRQSAVSDTRTGHCPSHGHSS